MNKPEISIIVPVYNVENYIHRCIESILNQTFNKFELILVNDGSSDNCPQICDQYSNIDNRIKVIHKKNGGVSSARNEGLKLAKGRYIGFVDSDDYIDKDMYELLYKAINENDADISICGHKIVENDKITQYIRNDNKINLYNKKEAVKKILLDDEINSFAWDKLYKRELFLNFEYPNLTYHEDLASTFKLLNKSDKIVCINKAKYNYVRNPNSICFTINPQKIFHSYLAYVERQKLIDKEYDELIEINQNNMYSVAINALNTMIRNNTYKDKYSKEYEILRNNIKTDITKIIENKLIDKRVKLYSILSTKNMYLYKCICKFNINKYIKRK